ncbi:MAG: hybrid sensor histidine kinase/response regulator [Chitinophagaceae bacterium]|nr:MAG: hybrid sensor histidine kinase/response regulator [Chitinophagaceae bacterium]
MSQKILLVDDREDNLFSMETILETENYLFVKATSGRQALKILLKEFDFALILMDVNMPNLNGFETASLIYEREKLRHIPIIFITANTYGEENVFKGYRMGAVDYIYKPVNPDLLRAKVSVFVDLYKQKHQLIMQEQKLVEINRNLQFEINERKASEEKIIELNTELLNNVDRLEKANKELDRFAFMASHDLQEPLRKILMFTSRIYAKNVNSLETEVLMDLKRIQKATTRMQDLIQDILMFSKVSVQNDSFVRSDMRLLIEEVLDDLNESIVAKNAVIELGQVPSLHVNPVLMRPLFFNLISNALKYSRPNVQPLIKIYPDPGNIVNGTNQVTDKNPGGSSKEYCRIYVKDNGIGFDQRYSEQIFEMFKRLHSQDEYEGTGIGLALCKQIVEKHNGFINVLSKINEGSTFIVSLPVAHNGLPVMS